MPTDNFLLRCLRTEDRALILEKSSRIALPLRTRLYEAKETPKHAYFMTSGVASVVTTMPDGATAEVNFTGREGVVGALHLMGPAEILTNCFVQMAGSAMRIPTSDLRRIFASSERIRYRILEFLQQDAAVVGQIAGCNRLHDSQERLARWLLMASDRMQSDEFDITQEFLAETLGSRRTTVTMVAASLQRGGLIEYRRGRMKILDRKGLEKTACACYTMIKDLYEGLYHAPAGDRMERSLVSS